MTASVVGAEVTACSQRPEHAPHLHLSMVWPDSLDRRQRWLYCLGAYDQARQLNAVVVDFRTERLVSEGAKPWEHPKTAETGWDASVQYQHWNEALGRWT